MVMEPTATNAVDMSRPFHSIREAVVEVFEEQYTGSGSSQSSVKLSAVPPAASSDAGLPEEAGDRLGS
jgi:hypothetical protein